MDIFNNTVLEKLPKHLKQFVVDQNYPNYTHINHATWRYVMRQNVDYLSKVAHDSYLDGLEKTGISINRIPNMYGMNRILKDIGWAAVGVDGFIPPAAFMEFQAYNVLVIAADIRQLNNIEYTPAPDIIHEAAGHAPIIANPEYAEYLRRFGEIGSKAISSAKDYELYEAVRYISIIKEDVTTNKEEILKAEQKIEEISKNMGKPSEMAMIRNLHWWTVEYGLIGDLKKPKIYGAGLLSSIGESKSCLKNDVKKIPYTIDAAYQNFDITKKQPQLFVTPDFSHLSFVLEEFASTMALRTGGLSGLKKLQESKSLGTIEYNTGLQVSGALTNIITDNNNNPIYIQTTGKTALSYRDKELIGHGTAYHEHGFGSPIGKLKNINIPIEKMSPFDLAAYHIREGEKTKLTFEGGITVEGIVITGTRNRYGRILLISFKECTVKHNNTILFEPEWGIYDMAVGSEIRSAYSGPADNQSFDLITHKPEETTHKIELDQETLALNELYGKVSKLREEDLIEEKSIIDIFDLIQKKHPNDWLLSVQLAEITLDYNFDIQLEIKEYLLNLKKELPKVAHLIESGMAVL